MSTALGLTTVAATITMGLLLARYAGARAREAVRQRRQQFEQDMDGFLSGELRGRDLLREADALEPELFWEAVGGLRAHLTRRGGAELEAVLSHCEHVKAERVALRDASPTRREMAARRLAFAGARRHYRAIRSAMVRGPEAVTQAAAMTLGGIRDGGSLRWVLNHPTRLEHRSPRARLAVLRSFGRGAVPLLLEALERGLGEPRMERAVIDALAALRVTAAAPAIARELDHSWRDARLSAARALGVLGAREHRSAVAERLERDEDWRVRAQAARSLGRLGATEAIPALRHCLTDRNWWVRRHAAYALAALGPVGRAVLDEVRAASSDPYARDIALEALEGGISGAS